MKIFVVNIFLISLLSGSGNFFDVEYLGMTSEEIEVFMNTEHKNFKLNTANINKAYNYLKYEDKINEITVLFFLNEQGNCKMVRLMSDYTNINDIEESLNKACKPVSKNLWKSATKHNVQLKLDEGDWFFTVTIEKV